MSEASTDSRPTSTVSGRLLDSTEKLLADKGIRATTMQQVAETAGVSRAWLYRHFPDKSTLIGAAIVRLNESFWSGAVGELDRIEGFDRQVAAGVRIGRGAYDDPGTLLMRLRTEEPDDFAACAGAGVSGLVPDLSAFWRPYVEAATDRGEIHPAHDLAEVSEWVARVLISLGTVPSETIDPDDPDAVLRHVRRYLMPGLRADPRDVAGGLDTPLG
ncbi:TetR/AcrR family transcriptional regulator [Gordonia aquimaris]|uniref:TetR/AcrR family transcriptional regulator n=1 Tax=Gordonia aquimaris TaxID=2984863 RepID=A0A9X3D6E0_9ACTN|nr:TetR/AcrR family transcriptional regulator [Gordonia aquimaris]MCX2964606.1 TetR/AcrR family transcriptional regulator [Gordonia aquimaris]